MTALLQHRPSLGTDTLLGTVAGFVFGLYLLAILTLATSTGVL
jgi:hypothetical protein